MLINLPVPKSKLINLFILFLVALFLTVLLLNIFRLSKRYSELKTQENNAALISPQAKIPKYIPSPTAVFTGADDAANEKYISDHPELVTEANLQSQLPLVLNGFILDYSYDEDKFTVELKEPIEDARVKFDAWRETVGLTDLNRFIIL